MAEPNIPPPLLLKELIASYPSLDEDNPSSWFIWSKTPGTPPKSYTTRVCHADMHHDKQGYDYLVTAVPKTDKVSLQYLRMIIHGPFKAFSDLISLVRVKENYYLQCSELEKWPANVLYNFCIASRAPIEFEGYVQDWQRLMGEGYPETLAFLMSQSMGGKPFKHGRKFPDHGHHWFDPSTDWKNIINGTPDLTGSSYHKSPASVTPSNAIWGKSEDYSVIMELDDLKTAEHFGFKHPPPKPKRELKIKPDFAKYQLHQWHDEANGMNPNAVQAAMNQLNQIQMQAQPNGAWAQVAQAIHDEGQVQGHWAPPNPAAEIPVAAQPFIHDDDEFPEHDDFPDFHEDDDD